MFSLKHDIMKIHESAILRAKDRSLMIILAFALILRLIFFTGSGPSDELKYYGYANDVINGDFKLEQNHFSFRIGLIYPTALIFYLFGINEFTANSLTLVSSLASIILIFYLGKYLFNEKTGLTSAFLLAIYPLDIVYATRLLPDLPSTLFMGLGVLLFLYGEGYERDKKKKKNKVDNKNNKIKQNLYYFSAGISLGIGYLIKEITLLMSLFFCAYFIYKKRFKLAYILIGIGVLVALLIQILFSYYNSGDPLYQYKILEQEEASYVKNYYSNYFVKGGLISRLFLHFPYLMLTDVHYGLFFIFVGLSTVYFLFKKRKETYVPIIWMLVLLLYFNFGTISLKEYVPYPVTARHLSIITFPVLLLIAYFLSEKPIKKMIPFLLILLLISSISYTFASDLRNQIKDEKKVYNYLSKNKEKIIYSDERTSKVLDYLFSFKKSSNIISFNDYDYAEYGKKDRNIRVLELKGIKNAYIVVNFRMITSLTSVYSDMKFPEEIFKPPKDWKIEKEFGSNENRIIVYST